MTIDEKLIAIATATHDDNANRTDLFAAAAADFAPACRSLAETVVPAVDLFTGVFVPNGTPPTLETDGPLGAVFLARAFAALAIPCSISAEIVGTRALTAGLQTARVKYEETTYWDPAPDPGGAADRMVSVRPVSASPSRKRTHYIAVGRAGPAADGKCYTRFGQDITEATAPVEVLFPQSRYGRVKTIGIGSGGHEIGMGKLLAANSPPGEPVHCRVATDFLFVAGVSNWGAYALAAGLFLLRGVAPPRDLFDPEQEQAILDAMILRGPLVDGVTGLSAATVSGLSPEDYARPLIRIRDILAS